MSHGPSLPRKALIRGWSMLFILALGLLWAPAPSMAADPETFAYTVQPGDTLYRLSVRFGTTVDTLVALNDIRNPDLIFVGQVLLVPAAGVPAGQPPKPAPPVGGPLSFAWKRLWVRHEGNNYVSTLEITAQGGQPPYTYYDDGLVQKTTSAASVTFDVPWRRGRNKPGSVGVKDATGTYVKDEYWLTDTCDYPAGVEITQPKQDAELKTDPRHFNIEWEYTIDPRPDAYWIEIQVRRGDKWEPWQTYPYEKGSSKLFFVPDEFGDDKDFPGELWGRLRMWGVYGSCEAREKTLWRKFVFRVTS